MARSSNRGQSLIEMLVALSITLLITGTALGISISQHPGGSGTSERSFQALVEEARAVASTSSGGATIVVGPSSCNGAVSPAPATACLYGSRPIGTGLPTKPLAAITLQAAVQIPSLGSAPYGIFISPSGYVAAAAWSPSMGPITTEPACAGALTVLFGGSSPGSLDCASATFTYPAPPTQMPIKSADTI